MPEYKVVLYTRQNCCLCDEAKRILDRHGLEPTLVDIDQNTEKLAQYNECVPVVEINGKVYFRGKVQEALLRRILRS